MSHVGGLDRLQQGVLLFLANRPVYRKEEALPLAETQGMSGPELLAEIGRTKVAPQRIGHRTHDTTGPLRLKNPYYTKDADAINSAVTSLRESGLVESRPPSRGSRKLVHFITRAGAEAIGYTALAEAIGEGVTAGVYRDRTAAPARSSATGADAPGTVAMSDVEGVLGTVLGRNSEAAKQILELLRDQQVRGR